MRVLPMDEIIPEDINENDIVNVIDLLAIIAV